VFYCEILRKCICWLIIKVILRNALCNNKDKNITVYVSGHTETDTSGMLSPPTVWRQQSEFVSSRHSGQIPAAVRIGFKCRCNVAISMDTHVGLNVATRVCDVWPDKCWFAELCRFWLQFSRALTRISSIRNNAPHDLTLTLNLLKWRIW